MKGSASHVTRGPIAPPVVFAEHRGYGIVQEIARSTNGDVSMGPGTLYGTLQRMCDAGLVEECPRSDLRGLDERRRYYRLTKKGQTAAVSEAERLERLLSSAYKNALIHRPTA